MENVATILDRLPWDDINEMLFISYPKLVAIESEFSTDKERLRALIQYWLLRDPYASWRRLIRQLDFNYSTAAIAASNSIRKYAEKLTGQ